MDKESRLKKTHTGWMLLTETQKRSETAQKQGKFVSRKDADEGFFRGEQPAVLCPLGGQPSIAQVVFAVGVVGTEAAFGTGLLFHVGSEQQEQLCCRASPILFPCRCT